ncbi:alpha/beta hydrolase [Veronia pacifica]|uniref:Alpha/beta hydrolase n=1 Tax=Veronia pacifica TaxID=1080227 RepID=A0A1C3EL35_9GAMM|nr:alpha/beta hydrolase [Veronia pacifica]ODA33946.1 hypothetical protein A8L45_07800 [Veronia pacifica]
MTFSHWPEVADIQSIVFGIDKPCKSIHVYLHGAGGFGSGYEGQYAFPDFASLLRDEEIELEQPFIVACCMQGEYWDVNRLIPYLEYLSLQFNGADIDIMGYSRGGVGVYELLAAGGRFQSATIINSRPTSPFSFPHIPIHIIHATDDQRTPIQTIEAFTSVSGNQLTQFTAWQGDHFSIAEIAKSKIWCPV